MAKKSVKLFWIDDVAEWASSVQENLKIIFNKYDVELIIVNSKNGEDTDVKWKSCMFDFDCIVMDYHMTPFNGDKYIRDIREYEHLISIPIIFYSQDTDVDLKRLVEDVENVITVFRGGLEDLIVEKYAHL